MHYFLYNTNMKLGTHDERIKVEKKSNTMQVSFFIRPSLASQ